MSWIGCIPWSESIKKRACRYLLQRYLGQFLEEKLTLDQLTVDLYNGTGRVTNVNLDVQALNETGEQQKLPLEFVDGFVEEMSVSIPWSALLSEASYVEVTGLRLTVQPRQRDKNGASMFESMLSSMTSSMQLAQECLKPDGSSSGNSQPLEGIERFAQTIDSILCRVKIRFLHTVIRLEHVPVDSAVGVALEIRIDNLEYSDEAGSDPSNASLDPNQTKGYIMSAFSNKRFYLEGVSFHVDEFPSKARTFSKSIFMNSRASTPDSKNSDGPFSSAQISPSQGMPTPPEKSGNLNNLNELNNPIPIAKLSGRQEIRLKLKQGEGIPGPKVELMINLGSLTLFLSPRQVHGLMELMEGLASPDMEDVSNVAPRQQCIEKPMQKSDFKRVEQELINQLNPSQSLKTMDLRNTHGWSTASLDDSDNEEIFLPMHPPGAQSMNNSVSSNNFSMTGSLSGSSISSKSSIASSAARQHKTHRHGTTTVDDLSAETSQFNLRVSSVAMVLLHEDILTSGIEGYGLTRASAKAMKNTAEEFFNKLGIITTPGYGNKDFEMASDLLSKSCELSHLRFLAAPLVMDASEKSTGQRSSMAGQLTLASLELVECLYDSPSGVGTPEATCIELLSFVRDGSRFSNSTNFQMKFSHTERAVKHGQTTKSCHLRTEFDITLEPCEGDLDISIVDRISSLLNRQPICVSASSNQAGSSFGGGQQNGQSQQNFVNQAVESPSLPETRTEVKVSASKCLIHLRFPIPDLRPAHDMGRAAWWRRSVRRDYASIELLDAKLRVEWDSQVNYLSRHELQCRQMLLSYTEADSDVALDIAKAIADEGSCEGFGWPRFVLTMYPQQHGQGTLEDCGEAEHEVETTVAAATAAAAANDDYSFEQSTRQQPSPFSSKRVIHESDTPHPKHAGESKIPSHQAHSANDETRGGEELVIPGNRQEMTEFIEEATRSARVQVELGLPSVSVQIPSKHLYELIYNRFNTDLLLWQSSAPKPRCPTAATPGHRTAANGDSNPLGYDMMMHDCNFKMCKSAIQYESESDTDADDLDINIDMQRLSVGESLFYSTSANSNSRYGKMKLDSLKDKRLKQQKQRGQSKVALSLNIGQGLLTMYSPVRDSERKVIPGQQGEVVLRVEDALVFSVSGYKSDENLGYVCVMVKDTSLYHCGLMTAASSQPPPLRSINSIIPKHCLRTIYRTEPSAQVVQDAPKDMLSVAVSIQAAHETHRIKTFKVGISLSQATLNHRVTSSQTSWFSQLSDCLDVIDHPVAGYTPPGILTELHLHLWECAIDYRPVHLPLRAFVSLGNFSLSSNIAAQTNTSTLRFIAEDLGLFISNRDQPQSQIKLDLRRDYVNVMELGLFELSLRLNERQCGGAPRVDLRASNNMLHMRTCSDSGRALMQLLTYFAAYGDLDPKYHENNLSPEETDFGESEQQRLLHLHQQQPEEHLLGNESINLLSKSQVERVNSLMEEAMEDTCDSESSESEKRSLHRGKDQQQVEVFFFPDEQSKATSSTSNNACSLGKKELITLEHMEDEPVTVAASALSDSDDDFCILGEEAGIGIIRAKSEPVVRWLTDEPVKIVENNYATPLHKRGLLQPPRHFPNPVLRYRLREGSFIWHMYGGKDFDENPRKPEPKIRQAVYFENDRTSEKGPTATYKILSDSPSKYGNRSNSDWIEAGGRGRRHDLLMQLQMNKVRFLHETYPDHTTQASWQGLEVNECEIRDRLNTSNINLFLTQDVSEKRPKQLHSNMFHVKATHSRPDPRLPAQECCLKINLKPLRLHIDQDSLLFIVDFFSELATEQPASASSASQQYSPSQHDGSNGSSSATGSQAQDGKSSGSKQGTPTHHPPVMSVNYDDDEDDDHGSYQAGEFRKGNEPGPNDRNLMILLEDELAIKESTVSPKVVRESQDNGQPIYFRSVVFSPDVYVRLDYQGKRVDLTHGPFAGLLMGLAHLNSSELKLKRICYRNGLLGCDKLISFLLTEWMQDIKKNQLPGLLGGVGPMYSVVQLFQGVRDLVWLPIEQYQKDGRIVRGLQRGANSFTTSTAMAALELTSRLVNAIQSTAETAYDMVSPGPSVRTLAIKGHKGRRKRYTQPIDIREGMANAYVLVKEGLGETASQLVRVASEEHEQKGVSGAVGGVLRQIPPTVVKPIILATEATNNVLGGMRSQLVPDARREAAQKWRSNDLQ